MTKQFRPKKDYFILIRPMLSGHLSIKDRICPSRDVQVHIHVSYELELDSLNGYAYLKQTLFKIPIQFH
jgi:hypothetical protein